MWQKLKKFPGWYFYVPALVLGLMFIPAAMLWSSMPSSRVTAVVYDQRNDSFSIETEPVRWWFRPKPVKQLEFVTKNEQGRIEGLLPNASYYKLELVPIEESDYRPIFPGLIDDMPAAPEGMGYKFQSWSCPSMVRYSNGTWRVSYKKTLVIDRIPGRALTVRQSRQYSKLTASLTSYNINVYGQSGLAFCGTGMPEYRTSGPLARLMRSMHELFE